MIFVFCFSLLVDILSIRPSPTLILREVFGVRVINGKKLTGAGYLGKNNWEVGNFRTHNPEYCVGIPEIDQTLFLVLSSTAEPRSE